MNPRIDARLTTNQSKSQAWVFESFWLGPGPILEAILDSFWKPILIKRSKERQPKINAKIDTEQLIESVAIEAKRAPKMKPKWSQES